jgi:transposase-like protein
MTPAQRDISRKLRIFNYAKQIGNVSAACRHFGISREIYYQWKRAYEKDGEQALVNSKPCPENPKLRTKPEVEEKILHLRRTYHFGQQRIAGTSSATTASPSRPAGCAAFSCATV